MPKQTLPRIFMLKYNYNSMLKLFSFLVPLLFVFSFTFLTPDIVSAQAGGFVTCSGTECSACNLVELVNNIIIWLFGLIFMIFAILMVVAGFGLVTSGGNPAALQAAKSKFTNAIIGVLIVLSAWTIVDTVMRSVVGGGNTGAEVGEIKGWGPWSEVKCQDQSDTTTFVDLNTGAGGTPSVTGQEQVPGSVVQGQCSVTALTEMKDSLALSMERGQSVVFNNPTLEQCAKKFVQAVGGGARINSAYRPAEYQTHLWELRDRWCTKGLRVNNDTSCSSLKSAIGSEVGKHFGSSWQCGAVGVTSRHSQGTAVDIGGISNHSDSRVQSLAAQNCLVWRNYQGDPYHYDLKSSCSCN